MDQTVSQPAVQGFRSGLESITLAAFASSLSTRALDPVVPLIADEFAVSVATAAGVTVGYMLTFGLVQPLLGPMADLFGKARLIIGCLVLLSVTNILSAFAGTLAPLLCMRLVAGVAAGGVVPVALSLVSDLVPREQRQVAIGRLTAGVMIGTLLGASMSGLISDHQGWRGALTVLGILGLLASAVVALGFSAAAFAQLPRADLVAVKQGYRTILSNPNARVCYSAVFIEGACVFGLFPFIASLISDRAQASSSTAGIVIGGFAVGGLIYAATISRVLPRLGIRGAMIAGAGLVGLQLLALAFGSAWKIQSANLLLMGFGFSLIHGCLQVFASELSAGTRAIAMSLHVFFYSMGQTVGPIVYGLGLSCLGRHATLLTAAGIMTMLGLACALLLKPPKRDEVGT
jgi:MFS transporter, DHA1 family, inner membrane transport protein